MSNELLFLLAALVDIVVVFIAARLGREWLLGTILVNLLLIGTFGTKLISIFGLVTNVGNVFYACVFLATHFFIERYGKDAAWQTVWFGVGLVLFFTVMAQFAVNYQGLGLSDAANTASATLFPFSSRVIFASMLAYVFAQYVNISLYVWIRERAHGKFLWLRSSAANITSQLVDSSLFFTIAFLNLPGPMLVQAILTGWLLKSLVGLAGTPFLYLNGYLERKKQHR